MPKVHFVEFGGEEHIIDADAGMTLMDAAVQNMVPGILAECGGACACATCHVVISQDWAGKLAEPSDMEQAMVAEALEYTETSRLACQVTLTDDLDGIVVSLPENQV